MKMQEIMLVEEGGFEPPKLKATDLQSAPFGHSGTPPYWSWWTDSNPRPADYKSAALPTELHQRHRVTPATLQLLNDTIKEPICQEFFLTKTNFYI